MPGSLPETEVSLSTAGIGGAAALLTAAGELDLHAAEPLRRALTPLVEQGRPLLIVDLTDVGFIDPTVLGVLVGAARVVRGSGGSFVVVSSDPRIVRLLEITGLAFVLDHHKTLAEALDEHSATAG